jgi:hypothetical protein
MNETINEYLEKTSKNISTPQEAATELKIVIKGGDITHTKKFLLYDTISMHAFDPIVNKCLVETQEGFVGEAEDIIINARVVLK